MGKNWDKFVLLLWKNIILHMRHPIQTAVEILVPVLITSVLIGFRYLAVPVELKATTYKPDNDLTLNTHDLTFIWSPIQEDLNKIMDNVQSTTGLKHLGFKDSNTLDAYINSMGVNRVFAFIGIQFDDSLSTMSEIPPNVNITLRLLNNWGNNWHTDSLYPQYVSPGPRIGESPYFTTNYFLATQRIISVAITDYFKNKSGRNTTNISQVSIQIQRFPYPKCIFDQLAQILEATMPTTTLLSFIYMCVCTVRMIVNEKEHQLKETMKIMGLPGWLHWMSWFITRFSIMLFTVILMIVLLRIHWIQDPPAGIFTHSDPLVIGLFFLLYIAATVTFSFAISVFCKKAQTATIASAVIWFISFTPFNLQHLSYGQLTLLVKILTSLVSNSGLGFGLLLILRFESSGEGIHWSNLWTTVTPADDLVMGHILIMLLVDTLLYLLIALYFDALLPGEFGVPEVWYFPFTKTYWCGSPSTHVSRYEDVILDGEYFEKDPVHLEPGITIHKLTKDFSNVLAVKNLSLNIYKDQITILLGHNGAGKTTTMSMLTGMITPTKGTAIIGGYDIRTEIDAVRESMGLCPQHNILFDDLTVSEHLYFYCRLKGMNKRQIQPEIDKYLELLELLPKANAKSSTLSGGMKRKLSVGVAFCGGSKVVMCDEPSSGMDPAARRALWDLLQSQKKGVEVSSGE